MITKDAKKQKVTFKDQVTKDEEELAVVHHVESYKKYNVIVDNTCCECVIF